MAILTGNHGEYELCDRFGKGASLTYRAINRRANPRREDPVVFVKFDETRNSRTNWDTQDQESIDAAGSADYYPPSSHPKDRTMLAREHFAHDLVSSPHIIGATDRELSPGTPRFLVFPFVRGRDLNHIINKSGPLRAKDSYWLIEDVCDGLDALHAAGLVHRDMKPSNIVVDREQARVADLGLVYHREIADWDHPHSRIGTPFYMSPEQVNGDHVSPATDVYGLSVTLYQTLTGKRPFTGRSNHQVMHDILHKEPPQPGISRAIDAVIMKGISKEPSDRYQSAAEFKMAFKEATILDKRTHATQRRSGPSLWQRAKNKFTKPTELGSQTEISVR